MRYSIWTQRSRRRAISHIAMIQFPSFTNVARSSTRSQRMCRFLNARHIRKFCFVLFVDVSFIQVDHNSWAQRSTCFRTINNNSHTCNYYSEFTWFAFHYGWSNLFVYIIISIQFNGETTMYECSFKLIVCFFNETSKCSGDVIPKYDEKSPSECHIWPKASNTNM